MADDLIRDLEEGLAIDENALEEALQAHPELFYRVSKRLALEISRRDALKQYVEEVKARADVEIREDFRKHHEKFTEKELDALVRTDREVIKAIDALVQKNRIVGQLAAIEKAFEQRSYALKNLVELYLQSYYGDASGGRSDLRDRLAREAREGMASERRTRSKRHADS